MNVRDLIEHLERVEETVGNVCVLVNEAGGRPGFKELNRISLVKVETGTANDTPGIYFGTYFRVHDDHTQGKQAVWLCYV